MDSPPQLCDDCVVDESFSSLLLLESLDNKVKLFSVVVHLDPDLDILSTTLLSTRTSLSTVYFAYLKHSSSWVTVL